MLNDLLATTALVWLLRTTLVGTVWLGLGGLALALTREPARRTLLCSLTLAGSLLIPVVCFLIGEGAWGVGAVWSPPPVVPEVTSPLPVVGATEEVSLPLALPMAPEAGGPEVSPVPILSSSTSSETPTLPADVSSESVFPAEGSETFGPADGPALQNPFLPAAATERAAPHETPARRLFPVTLLGAYFGGAALFLFWYAAGLWGVRRLVAAAQAPSAPVESLWKSVRGVDLRDVPLRMSPRVPQPIACWSRGPCVLLPVSWSDVPADRLQWALAHEAEHIRRGDYWNWQIANLARCCYWFHPLAWWLRAELRQAQDYIADSAAARSRLPVIAADAGDAAWGRATDYAEFLKASACTPIGRSPLVGLGLFGRKSHLYRRIAMLLKNDGAIETRPPRWWKVACITWGLGLFVTLTTLKIVSDPPIVATARAATEVRPAAVVDPPAAQPGGGGIIGSGFAPPGIPGMESGDSVPFAPGGSAGPPGTVTPAGTFAPIMIAGGTRQAVPGSEFGQPGAGSGFGTSPGNGASDARPAAAAPTSVRKLDVENGFVSPEPGVKIGIVTITDPVAMSSWGMDGGTPLSPAAMMSVGMGGGGYPGDAMMMSSSMGGAGMYGGGYGPAVPSVPEDHRRRDIEIHVQRPTPQGLSSSIDGQTAGTRSDSLSEPKIRRLLHSGYWPQEQLAGSVGVRFASQSVAREIVSSNPQGESFPIKPAAEGGRASVGFTSPDPMAVDLNVPGASSEDPPQKLAVLGAWWAGSDLSTRIPFRHAHPADFPFVLQAQATDVDGQTHPGRIEHQAGQTAMMPGFGGMGAVTTRPESSTIVFAHLPPSRIKSVRVTWHPYAWVIFRNVSLDAGQETKPTAELFVDGATPPPLPPTVSTTKVRIPVQRETLFQVGDIVTVFIIPPRLAGTNLKLTPLFVAPLEEVEKGAGEHAVTIALEKSTTELFELAKSKGEIAVMMTAPGTQPAPTITPAVAALLKQLPPKPVPASDGSPAYTPPGSPSMSLDLSPSAGTAGAPMISLPRGMRLIAFNTPADGIERGDQVSIEVSFRTGELEKTETLLSPVEVFAVSRDLDVTVLLKAGSEVEAVQLARRKGTVTLRKVEPDAQDETDRKINADLLKALETAKPVNAPDSPATPEPEPQPQGTTNLPAADARIRLSPKGEGPADPAANEGGLRLI